MPRCRPDLFFPIASLGPAQYQTAQAKAVCAACPVGAACLSYALEAGQRAGIWGGTTEDERRQIRSAKTARRAFPHAVDAGPIREAPPGKIAQLMEETMHESAAQLTFRPGQATGEVSPEREKVRFASGDTECAAWRYPGTNGACVIMTGGFAVTKEPGTDPFARRFAGAGFSVLAFDYRRLGESGGQPRQVARVRDQLADWQAAIAYAAGLPGVEPGRLGIWGFSASGGHVLRVAASNPDLGAAIAQTPNVGGLAPLRNVARHQEPLAMARFAGRGVLDGLGRLIGRPPRLVPLAGEPGRVVMLTTPDGRASGQALNPGNAYPDWQQEVAAWSALRFGFYQPGRFASRVACPLLVVVCENDQSALAGPAIRAAHRAPTAELARLPGGHYAPFLDAHKQAVAAELSFLCHQLLGQPAPAAADAGMHGGGRS